MGRSLFFKLLGAFAFQMLVLAVIATVLANQATEGEFRTYTDRNGQVWAAYLAPALADYYSQNNSWDGLNNASPGALLATATPQALTLPSVYPTATPVEGMGRSGMGRGMMGMGSSATDPIPGINGPGAVPTSLPSRGGMGPGMRGGQASSLAMSADVWSMMGHRVIVANAAGQVVSDSAGNPSGAVLSPEELASGQPIHVAGEPAGTVLVEAGSALPGTPAGEFLRAMNRSILLAFAAASTVALLLGSILFFQITAPVRKLKAAASAIAAGDYSQRVQVTSRDELGDLANTFNSMAESLRQAETLRRHMVADVAHELRTPLSVMQANLEAMQDGVLPLEAQEIASLHEETVVLSRLVGDLHLLSLAEAGQLKLEQEEIEPGELVRRSAGRFLQAAQDRGVTIQFETPAALPPVLADSGRINQVIGNLLSNALRYTGPGGSITIRVDALSDKPLNETRRRAPEVLVSFTDTGCGIPETDLPYIFERFYRADKSRSRSTGGSGLGLAIIKLIVEAHGGRVWAESPVSSSAPPDHRGTRISFTLPICPGAAAS